jgi:hypothetical protein
MKTEKNITVVRKSYNCEGFSCTIVCLHITLEPNEIVCDLKQKTLQFDDY